MKKKEINDMGKEKLRSREEIPAKYKWNMQDMFASDELWEEEARIMLFQSSQEEISMWM